MTKILEQAFARASRLPPREQNVLAKWMLEELESEKRWQKAFRRTATQLAVMADAALEEHRSGRTKALGLKGT